MASGAQSGFQPPLAPLAEYSCVVNNLHNHIQGNLTQHGPQSQVELSIYVLEILTDERLQFSLPNEYSPPPLPSLQTGKSPCELNQRTIRIKHSGDGSRQTDRQKFKSQSAIYYLVSFGQVLHPTEPLVISSVK